METVYQPSVDSFLLQESMQESHMRGEVLDMGTGSGVLAITAAKLGCSVTAVDVNSAAIDQASDAARKQGLDIKFILSDLFQDVKGKFDYIVFNTPYVPTKPDEIKDMESIAWDGGEDGLQVTKRFLKQSKEFLKPDGKILLLVSSNTEDPPIFKDFEQKTLKKLSFFFERLFVLELS
jgi:release factor glutamine methyltransferase